jgi:hypothetical protein
MEEASRQTGDSKMVPAETGLVQSAPVARAEDVLGSLRLGHAPGARVYASLPVAGLHVDAQIELFGGR